MQPQQPEQALPVFHPSFLVGISGYMDVEPKDAVQLAKRLRLVLRFLRFGGQGSNPERTSASEESLAEALVELLVPSSAPHAPTLRQTYLRLFADFPGMDETPIVLMTNLAPGVDSIAAGILDDICDFAERKTFAECGFRVVAPLPFPADSYPRATTFAASDSLGQDTERVNKFHRLVSQVVGLENTFCVRLVQEKRVPESELAGVREADLQSSEGSDRRYYAAGEYLTTHCHLMICAWDGSHDPDSVGTPGVAHARLHGPKLGLQVNEGISMPHGGPLLHLYLNDPTPTPANEVPGKCVEPEKATASGSPNANSNQAPPRLPPARFLFPFRESADDQRRTLLPVALGQETNASLQTENLATFLSLIDNLVRFNQRVTQWGGRRPRYLAMALEDELRADVADQNADMLPALDRAMDLQGMADETSVELVQKTRLAYALIFFCTLSAAVCLHGFSHWHPQNEHHAPATVTSANADTDHNTNHEPIHAESISNGPWVRQIAGLGMLLFSVTGLGLLAGVKGRRLNECADDYRALAEALRVQLCWNIAGLGQSVPARYMQRQRGELYWIRGAVRSVVAPYGRWYDWFHAFRPETKIALLKVVHRDWICSQRDYFVRTFDRHHCKLHFGHQAGGMLALSGLGIATLAWAKDQIGFLDAAIANPVSLFVVGALALLCLVCVGAERLLRACRLGEMTDLQVLVACLVPEPDTHTPVPPYPDRKLSSAIVRFFWYIPAAVCISTVGIAVCSLLTTNLAFLPNLVGLTMIVAGTWLVAGAMLVAWAERNLYSETAYQYHTMASLYGNADDRMVREIRQLEEIQRRGVASESGAHEPDCTQEFELQVERIHEFLLALGKEALDENAEWLILHRSRPLEPVMAG